MVISGIYSVGSDMGEGGTSHQLLPCISALIFNDGLSFRNLVEKFRAVSQTQHS